MNRRVAAVLVVLVVLAIATTAGMYIYSAKRRANVTVSCLELDHLHSNLGALNVPAYPLGKVLVLDRTTKKVQGLMTLTTTDSDLAKIDAPQDTSVKLDTKLEMTFDADVPETIKAQASTTLRNLISVELEGMVRTDLANPYALANASADLKEQVRTLSVSRAVVLVSTIKKADSLEIKLADDAQVKTTGNVLQVGKYEVAVTYKCDGLYKAQGMQVGVFYGVASLDYDQKTGTIIPGEPVDVWTFDHAQAFQ